MRREPLATSYLHGSVHLPLRALVAMETAKRKLASKIGFALREARKFLPAGDTHVLQIKGVLDGIGKSMRPSPELPPESNWQRAPPHVQTLVDLLVAVARPEPRDDPPLRPSGPQVSQFNVDLPLFTFADLDRFVAPVARQLAEAEGGRQRATQDCLELAVRGLD